MGTVVTLQALTQTSDIVLGTPFINRPGELESNSVGLFLHPLPFRLDLGGNGRSRDGRHVRGRGRRNSEDSGCDCSDEEIRVSHLLDQTKTSLQDILSHAIPWHQLLSHLGLELPKDGTSYPLFDTVVSLHDYSVMEPLVLDINGAGPADEPPYTSGSKFKIMFEYTVSRDSALSLRVEYCTSRVSEETVATMYKGLVGCFVSLSVSEADNGRGDATSSSSDSFAALRDAVLDASGGAKVLV